jgi:alpha-L-fucosidase 2
MNKAMCRRINCSAFICFLIFLSINGCKTSRDEVNRLRLWYEEPATDWMTEALPIGNGFMGVMFYGGHENEQLQFSEGSLWSGGPGSHADYNFGLREGAWRYLPQVRILLEEKKFSQAHSLAREKLTGVTNPVAGYSFGDYGAQQTMGDLHVSIVNQSSDISDYIRELDISSAIGKVSYLAAGTLHRRTFFGCFPEKVMVYHFENDAVQGCDYSINIDTPHNIEYAVYEDGILRVGGHVADNKLGFETGVLIETDGSVSFDGQRLTVSGAGQVLLVQTAATAYTPSFPDYRGNDYKSANLSVLNNARDISFNNLMEIHQQDYQGLFNRVTLRMEGPSNDSLPTGKRLVRYASGLEDTGLEILYFQYGRYLMISSSRPGTMPMHLQGKWNNSTNPPWAADYHTNINLQMLYWPAEVTNLSECHVPLIDYIGTLVPPGRLSAREFFGARGWIVNTMNNAWGYTSPGWDFPWGFFPAGAAWLCQHVWEHFDFSADTAYLRDTAYPLMQEAALFWVDYLTEDENGFLVSKPSYSPEHGGISEGASMDHQIAWDLLNNCVLALEILGTDPEMKKILSETRDRIIPPSVGAWGQLQEWKEDVDDPGNRHRHISHLFALHPGRQITVSETPELAGAARVSLEARGDGGTGWSLAWKVNFRARLEDGNRAYALYKRLLRPTADQGTDMTDGGGSYSNLLCAHPPFQLDGNMGGTAGVAEMLIQSHNNVIHILPAVPDQWSTGEVRGLRARGGFTVGFSWEHGLFREGTITGPPGARCIVKTGDAQKVFSVPAGGVLKINLSDLKQEK